MAVTVPEDDVNSATPAWTVAQGRGMETNLEDWSCWDLPDHGHRESPG